MGIATPTKPLDREQAAMVCGVSTRHFASVVADGKGPPKTEAGKYDPSALGRWLRERFKQEFGVSGDGEAYDGKAEAARLDKARADKVELEVQQLRGELVSVADVERVWTSQLSAMRARLLLIAPSVAPKIAPPGKTAEIQAEIERFVFEALTELAHGQANGQAS